MRFAPRVAVLAAAVGIPLGAVFMTYAFADEGPGPTAPAEVRIGESRLTQEPAPKLPSQPAPLPPPAQAPAEVVPPPPPPAQAPVEVAPPPPPVAVDDDDDDGYRDGNGDDDNDGYRDGGNGDGDDDNGGDD